MLKRSRKTKLLAWFLSASMVLSLFPAQVLAAEVQGQTEMASQSELMETASTASITSGTCGGEGDGSNLTWVLKDGVLTISGTGKMKNWQSSGTNPWYDYRSDITDVCLEPGVTSIGESAFYDCNGLNSMTIPGSVTSIGASAFSGCSHLASVEISSSVTSIGNSAFLGCSSLTSVEIPGSVTNIGSGAFRGCVDLTSVTISEGVTSIGNCAFYNCRSLTSVKIPASATIGTGVFAACIGLKTVQVAEGNETYVGGDVLYQPGGIFLWCAAEKSGAYTIPAGITSIGDCAFWGCSNLTRVEIPDSVVSIDNNAFQYCEGLTSIEIPACVTSIGEGAFDACYSLTTVHYSGTQAEWEQIEIGTKNQLFLNAELVTNEIASGTCGENVSWYLTQEGELVIYGEGDVGRYSYYTMPWYDYLSQIIKVTVKEGVSSVGGYTFCYAPNLTSVVIPEGVTSIGDEAFYYCEKLTAVVVPGSVNQIGINAFYGCSGLKDVFYMGTEEEWNAITVGKDNDPLTSANRHYISDLSEIAELNVGSFENGSLTLPALALKGESVSVSAAPDEGYELTKLLVNGEEQESLSSFVVPNADSVTVLAVFEKTVVIPEDAVDSGTCGENVSWYLTQEGELVIYGKGATEDLPWPGAPWEDYIEQISSITVQEGVTRLGNFAFYGCSALEEVSLPESLTEIGESAFMYCSSLPNFVIPENVEDIGPKVFMGCERLGEITVADGNTNFVGGSILYSPNDTFLWCTALEDGVCKVPDGIKTVADGAFGDCFNLTGVSLPDSLISLGEETFHQCWSLTSLVIPKGVTVLERAVFTSCQSLEDVVLPDGLTSIDYIAFEGCRALTDVTIPESVTKIAENAFWGCSSLTEVTIPAGVTYLGDGVFSACSNLEQVTVADGNKLFVGGKTLYSPGGRFIWCSNLLEDECIVSNGISVIGRYAFYECSKLEEISLPGSLTRIEEQAFYGCTGISSMIIPSGVEEINNYAFYGCSNLEWCILPENLTTINVAMFSGCTALSTIVIPGNVTYVDQVAFEECSALAKVYYMGTEDAWVNIEMNSGNDALVKADLYCINNRQDIVILDDEECENGTISLSGPIAAEGEQVTVTVTPDEGYVIYALLVDGIEQKSLDSFVVPETDAKSVTVTAIFRKEIPKGMCGENLSWILDEETGELTITGTGDMYDFKSRDDTPWSEYRHLITKVVVEEGVTSIGSYAFMDCPYTPDDWMACTTEFVLADSIRVIGDWAFSNFNLLTMPELPNDLEVIGDYAFNGCQFSTLVMPQNVTSIGRHALVGGSIFFEGDAPSVYEDEDPTPGYVGGDGSFDGSQTFYFLADRKGWTGSGISPAWETYDTCVYAEFEESSVNCGPDLEWTLEDGVLTISGTGDMYTYMECDTLETGLLPPWAESKDAITKVVIEAGVTSISDRAFADCVNLAEVEIADTVTIIRKQAFTGCSSLTSLTVPGSVKTIGRKAFAYCSALERVILEDGVSSIGYYAFGDCDSLAYVRIPASVKCQQLENKFLGCPLLTSAGPIDSGSAIEFGWVEEIPDDAFNGIVSLVSVIIPDTVARVGERAFWNCPDLMRIKFLGDAPYIVEDAFSRVNAYAYYPEGNATWTKDVLQDYGGDITWIEGEPGKELYCGENLDWTLEDGVLTITGTGDMYDYESFKETPWYKQAESIVKVVVEEGVTSIGDNAFNWCYNVETVDFADSITRIGDSAFRKVALLREMTLPDGLKEIGDYAFRSVNLTELIIPEHVSVIGKCAFRFSGNIYFKGDAPLVGAADDVILSETASFLNYSILYYQADSEGWSYPTWNGYETGVYAEEEESAVNCGPNLTWTLEDGVLTISGTGPMYSYLGFRTPWAGQTVTKVVVEDGVTCVSDGAFWCDFDLEEVVLADSVSYIGQQTFEGCMALTDLTLPAGLKTIRSRAFIGCRSLAEVILPDGVTRIDYHAFENCAALASVKIPTSAVDMDEGIFARCPKLTSAGPMGSGCSIEFGWTDTIPALSFAHMDETFRSVTIPEGIRVIGHDAFESCAGLTKVVFPVTVESIGERAFSWCTGLKSISFYGDCPEMNSKNSFSNVSSTAYYPAGNDTWTKDKLLDYGGNLTWEAKEISGAQSGTCGEGLTWNLDIYGTLTISGTGAMTFDEGEAPWADWADAINKVVVEQGVTTLADGAFVNCTSLKHVVLADSMTAIGEVAFAGCTSLTELVIPEGVTTLGSGFVGDCSSLESVIIPATVSSMGNGSFSGCPYLTSAGPAGSGSNIQYGWTEEIPAHAFGGSNLMVAVIPDGVTVIGARAFSGSGPLREIYFTGDAPDIAEDCFEGVTAVAYYPADNSTWAGMTENYGGNITWKNIEGLRYGQCGESVFWTLDAEGLMTIFGTGAMYDYYNSIANGDAPWRKYEAEIVELVVQDGVTTLPGGTFVDCVNLAAVSLPESLVSIGEHAFSGCDSLTELVIPEGVRDIDPYAFSFCENLQKVIIPASVTNINGSAFMECYNLSDAGPIGSGCSVEFGWTEQIPSGAFWQCSWLSKVTIPNGIKEIGNDAFAYCYGLSEIAIPDSVYYIGDYAFGACYSLQNIFFQGEAPSFKGESQFSEITATVYYPAGDKTWTEDVMQDYGGTITWVAQNSNSIFVNVETTEDGIPVTVTVQVEDPGYAMVAFYTSNGQMVDMVMASVVAGTNTIDLGDLDSAFSEYSWKILITDDGYSPVCVPFTP